MSEPTYATTDALAGLATEVDGLRKQLAPVTPLPGKLAQLADQVADLADDVQEVLARARAQAVPSWLLATDDPQEVGTILAELMAWMDAVWLRWPDAAEHLPACWLWHPHVIEELLVCEHLWLTAYQGKTASAQAAGDWIDRYRPGVVRRIKDSVGSCSLEKHATPAPPVSTPVPGAAQVLVAAWCTARNAAPPVPGPEHYAAAPARGRLAHRPQFPAQPPQQFRGAFPN